MITAGSYKTRLALLNLHVATSLVSGLNNVDRPLGPLIRPRQPRLRSSLKNSTDIRYRPSQSTVDTHRSKRSIFRRCPYPQCLRFPSQVVSSACGIDMCSPLEVKRREARPILRAHYMFMLRRILLLLIHLSPQKIVKP